MLSVESLRAWYGHTQALFDVSFSVQSGEVLGIVGTNGAGKTTAIKSIMGLVRTEGAITADGQRIDSWPAHRRVRECGFAVVHESRSVFPMLTVRENLMVGQPRSAADNLDRAFDLFPVLAERRSALVGSLSGGQRQMVALARAVVHRPRCLLLDEPSLGLAPLVVDEIYDCVRRMLGEDLAVVVVEQSIARVRTIADRLLLMSTGHSAQEVRSDDDDAVSRLEGIAFGETNAEGAVAS